MTADLAKQSIHELATLLRSGETSSAAITSTMLENIHRHDAAVKAHIAVYEDSAMASAEAADAEMRRGMYRGPVHGIPIGIKDNVYFAHRVTTMGSKIHRDFIPRYTATVVERLAAEGAVFTGKLNMHEYALGASTDNKTFGTCRNPWDLSKSPGGSSGGSGAAVAGYLATAALGTDTSGSIRIPAALCGVVGLKPTYGRLSRHGVFPEAWTLDHVGPMTRCVKDAAILLDSMSGYDPRDATSMNAPTTGTAARLRTDCRGLTIGIVEDFYFSEVDDEIARCVRDGIERLKDAGAKVVHLNVDSLKHVEYALTIIDTCETSSVHHANLRTRPHDFSDDVRVLLQCGELPSAVDYLEAQQLRRHIYAEVRKVFDTVDVLIGPTLPVHAPNVGEDTALLNGTNVNALDNLVRLMGPASLLGLPSLSVPCGLASGMPVGLQIIGPSAGEQVVLDVGHVLESVSPPNGLHAVGHL